MDHKAMRRKLWSLTQLRWFVLKRDADAHGNRYLWGGRPALPETADYHQHEMLRYSWLLVMTHPVLGVYIWDRGGEAGDGAKPIVMVLGMHQDISSLFRKMWGQYRVNWD